MFGKKKKNDLDTMGIEPIHIDRLIRDYPFIPYSAEADERLRYVLTNCTLVDVSENWLTFNHNTEQKAYLIWRGSSHRGSFGFSCSSVNMNATDHSDFFRRPYEPTEEWGKKINGVPSLQLLIVLKSFELDFPNK